MIGTLTFQDIYGAGSLDTLPQRESVATQQKANPNNPDVTGEVRPEEKSILHVFSGNFLGQPIMVWAGLMGLLVLIKFIVEKAD